VGIQTVGSADAGFRYCGRLFSPSDLETIRQIIGASEQHPTRAAISRAVCTVLDWRKPDGDLKAMSCRVALLRMQRDGLITLPPPTSRSYTCGPTRFSTASDPQPPITGTRRDLGELELRPVASEGEARLWRELVARYHYLGYTPLPGAQLRYLAFAGDNRLLAVMGFGAAAWKVAPRDHFIGWNSQQRQARLHLVVNQARFLVLPWVHVKNLASSLLAMAARRLAEDWNARYAYRPLVLETFVERPRHAGTCYRAANWTYVGQTQGRGKLDRAHRRQQPVKDVYLYPLRPDFRQLLCAPVPAGPLTIPTPTEVDREQHAPTRSSPLPTA